MSKTRFRFFGGRGLDLFDSISMKDDLYEKYFYPLLDDADKRFGTASVDLRQLMLQYAQQLAEYQICFTEPHSLGEGREDTTVMDIHMLLKNNSDNWGASFQRMSNDASDKVRNRCIAQLHVLVSRDDSYELHQHYAGKEADKSSPYYQWEELYRYLYYNPERVGYVSAGVTDIALIERCIAAGIDPQIAASMVR